MALDFDKIKNKLKEHSNKEQQDNKNIKSEFSSYIQSNESKLEELIQGSFEESAEKGFDSIQVTLYVKGNKITIEFDSIDYKTVVEINSVERVGCDDFYSCVLILVDYLESLKLKVPRLSSHDVHSSAYDFANYIIFFRVTPYRKF